MINKKPKNNKKIVYVIETRYHDDGFGIQFDSVYSSKRKAIIAFEEFKMIENIEIKLTARTLNIPTRNKVATIMQYGDELEYS